MPPRNKYQYVPYKLEVFQRIKMAIHHCNKNFGEVIIGYDQGVEKVGDVVGGGICYGLVQTWMVQVLKGGLKDSYDCLPVEADLMRPIHKAAVQRQLVSLAMIHRANEFTLQKYLNPFSTLKAANVVAANKDLKNKQFAIQETALSFLSESGDEHLHREQHRPHHHQHRHARGPALRGHGPPCASRPPMAPRSHRTTTAAAAVAPRPTSPSPSP